MDKTTKVIGDRIYCVQNGKFGVVHNPSVPRVLYKYYSLNKNSIDALEKHYIYAANPMEENDLYDSTPLLIDIQSEGAKKILAENNISSIETNKGTNAINPNYQNLGNAVYKNWRIISLTKECKNELMWAHYARQTGFCVEFNTKEILKIKNIDGIYPIQYRELSQLSIESPESELIPYIMCLQKNKVWEYEKEWRCLVKNPSQEEMMKLKYDNNPIRAIYLGYNFFDMNDRITPPYNTYHFSSKKEYALGYALRLLKYIEANNIPFYINYALRLGEYKFKKCEIQEINKNNKCVIIKDVDRNQTEIKKSFRQ